jgi:hypothetical protein
MVVAGPNARRDYHYNEGVVLSVGRQYKVVMKMESEMELNAGDVPSQNTSFSSSI